LRVPEGSVLIDPMEACGLDEIAAAGDVVAIVITVGWHERQAALFAKRTGAPVFVPAADTCMLESLESYETFVDGAELPLGLLAVGVPGLTRGEQALFSPRHAGTLLVGDALGTTAKWAPGDVALGGHPTGHPQPWQTLAHLLDLEFENLLPGHGEAIIGRATETLRDMIDRRVSTTTDPPRVTYFPKWPIDPAT
jgi:hypothetical protein